MASLQLIVRNFVLVLYAAYLGVFVYALTIHDQNDAFLAILIPVALHLGGTLFSVFLTWHTGDWSWWPYKLWADRNAVYAANFVWDVFHLATLVIAGFYYDRGYADSTVAYCCCVVGIVGCFICWYRSLLEMNVI